MAGCATSSRGGAPDRIRNESAAVADSLNQADAFFTKKKKNGKTDVRIIFGNEFQSLGRDAGEQRETFEYVEQ